MDQPMLVNHEKRHCVPNTMNAVFDATKSCRRMVTRHGLKNVRPVNITNKKERFLADYFTTLLEAKWHWIFLLFCSAFVGSWASFGTVWYGIVRLRAMMGSDATCIENVNSWTSAFLFSVESQTTIGYGGRQVTPECPEAVACLLVQSLCGVILSASLLGLIFAKLARPRPRSQTLMFSQHAVIDSHDGKMCLKFRVADMRKNQLLNVSLRAFWLAFHAKKHGGFTVQQRPLQIRLENEGESTCEVHPFLFLPNMVVHVIDEKSPFYKLSPENLKQSNFEIVAVLEGTVESSGLVTQAKASYLPSDIEWGQGFAALTVKSRERGGFQVDMSNFDRLVPVSLPSCSAKELKKFIWKRKHFPHGPSDCRVWIPMEQQLSFR